MCQLCRAFNKNWILILSREEKSKTRLQTRKKKYKLRLTNNGLMNTSKQLWNFLIKAKKIIRKLKKKKTINKPNM